MSDLFHPYRTLVNSSRYTTSATDIVKGAIALLQILPSSALTVEIFTTNDEVFEFDFQSAPERRARREIITVCGFQWRQSG